MKEDVFMIDAAIMGLVALLNPFALLLLAVGVIFGLVVGFLPGLGGVVVLVLLMPFIYNLEPGQALALLWGAHVAVCFGGSISAILFNVPGSSKNVAACFDGYPMTQNGEGARALAASAMSSLLGGFFGALVLLISLPVIRPIILVLGPAEYFMLALWGISVIALFTSGSFLKGLAAAGLGLLIAFVGMDPMTGTPRFTMGLIALWEGIDFPSAVLGMFAIAQMIELSINGGAIVKRQAPAETSGPMQGIKDTFKNWFLVVRSSILGVFIGALPGVGGTVGNIISYGQAVQTSKHPEKFGTGISEGVIACEAAVASNEGGGLIPTLTFGIPGGEGPAILMIALLIMGIAPGPEMMTKHLDIVLLMVWIIVFANVLATGIGLALAKKLVRISSLPGTALIPFVFVICLIGAYAVNRSFSDVIIAVVFGIIGYYMKKYDYSRANLIIGMVMGSMIERYYHISVRLFGNVFFVTRPIALGLLIVIIVTTAFPLYRKHRRKKEGGMTV
jgi:TctA family transporter